MGSNKRVLLILWISQFLLMLFGFYILIVIRLLLLVLLPLAMALQNHLFLVFLQLLQIQSLGIVGYQLYIQTNDGMFIYDPKTGVTTTRCSESKQNSHGLFLNYDGLIFTANDANLASHEIPITGFNRACTS